MSESNPEVEEPTPTFDVLPLTADVRRAIDELGYESPTPVQREVFEPATRGKDLVVQARTGTGKTAAFGLPLVDNLVKQNVHAVQAIILCPTRELALQVERELTQLGKYRQLDLVAVYGGAAMGKQIDQLEAGAQILCGTPGRVLDHLRRGTLDPSTVRSFVLDESDEMLSMGFLPQINEIWSYLPERLQVLLFSATVPPDIKRMAENRLKDPEFITLSGDHIGALEIEHYMYMSATDKLSDFLLTLEIENPESAIVFCNTRDATKTVAKALQKKGYAAEWLNADLQQSDRERVMQATRESKLRFLVCTDVAARGIDISHLTHVINYDFPESMENYVHRTGRTGRAGRTGVAISMLTPSNVGNVYMLRLTYGIRPVEKSLPTAREQRNRAELDMIESLAGVFEKRELDSATVDLARRLLTHDKAELLVAGLLNDHFSDPTSAQKNAADDRRGQMPTPVVASEASPEAPAADDDASGQREGKGKGRGKEKSRSKTEGDKGKSKGDKPRKSSRSKGAADDETTAGAASDEANTTTARDAAPGGTAADRATEARHKDADDDEDRPRRSRRRRGGRRDRDDVPGDDAPVASDDAPEASDDADVDGVELDMPGYVVSDAPVPDADDDGSRVDVRRDDTAHVESKPRRRRRRGPSPDDAAPAGDDAPAADAAPTADPSAPPPTDTAALPRTDDDKPPYAEVYVNVGRRDGASIDDYEELLFNAGVTTRDLDYIRVRHRNTFIGVLASAADLVIDTLHGAEIAGKEALAELARQD